jgi:hypothetical protein
MMRRLFLDPLIERAGIWMLYKLTVPFLYFLNFFTTELAF